MQIIPEAADNIMYVGAKKKTNREGNPWCTCYNIIFDPSHFL